MSVFLIILAIISAFVSRIAHARVLAKAFYPGSPHWDDQEYQEWFRRYNHTFYVEMGEYVRVEWEYALAESNWGVSVPLSSSPSSYHNAFLSFITDGEDLKVTAGLEKMSQSSGLSHLSASQPAGNGVSLRRSGSGIL